MEGIQQVNIVDNGAMFKTVYLSHHLTPIQLSNIHHNMTVKEFKEVIRTNLTDQIPMIDKISPQFLRLCSGKKALFDDKLPLRSYSDDDQALHLDLYILPGAYYELRQQLYELQSMDEIIEMIMKLYGEIEVWQEEIEIIKEKGTYQTIHYYAEYDVSEENESPSFSVKETIKNVSVVKTINAFKCDEMLVNIRDHFNEKIQYDNAQDYQDLIKISESMMVPLEKYQEICESKSPKVIAFIRQFAENYIIIHRNVKRLRDKMILEKTNKMEKMKKFEQEIRLQLYNLQQEDEEVYFPSCTSVNSANLFVTSSTSIDQIMGKDLAAILSNVNGPNTKRNVQLLYRSSRDGKDADAFHQLCDNKGPTVTVIRDSNGNVFGGYTSKSWNSNGKHVEDPAAFVFTLKNPANIRARRFDLKVGPPATQQHNLHYNNRHYAQNVPNDTSVSRIRAIYCDPKCGPIFGNNDIHINATQDESCYTNIGQVYDNNTGFDGRTIFTGRYNFTPDEIEVFSIN
jgi:hypothetical protein